MARFSGAVGYAQYVETAPGVWSEEIVERHYIGDLTQNLRRLEAGEGVNDNVSSGNVVSVLADAFAWQNFQNIRYVVMYGSKWKVTSVEVNRPRLRLSLGGVYNATQN